MKRLHDLAILGLSRRQERVLRALMDGHRTPLSITRATRISRPTVYVILTHLKKRGLVYTHTVSGKKQWEIVSSYHIENACTRLKNYLVNAPGDIKEVTTQSVHVVVYDGEKVARHLLDDFFTNPVRKRFRGLQGDTADSGWLKLCTPEEIAQRNDALKTHGVISEAIMPDGWIEKEAIRLGIEWIKSQQGRIRRTHVIAPRYFNHGAQLFIFDDAIYLLSLNEALIIEIRNTEIRKMLISLFEFMQDNATAIDGNAVYQSLLEQALAKQRH